MVNECITFKSTGAEETRQLGRELGRLVQAGQIILLKGNLGAGKTAMVQGIAGGLGLDENITSPTFSLINEYQGKIPLYHMDLYRLDSESDLIDIGFEEYLDREGVVVIEWPELALPFLEPDFLLVKILVKEQQERDITLEAQGESSLKLLRRLSNVDSGD